MKPRLTLKQQIAFTYLLLAFAVATTFSLVSYTTINIFEQQVIQARLNNIAGQLLPKPISSPHRAEQAGAALLADSNIPPALRELPDGLHKVDIDQHQVYALLRHQDGHRYAIVQDLGELEYTERAAFIALACGLIASLLLAVSLGRWSSRRIIAPVAALANAVRRDTAPAALPSLKAPDEIGVLSRAFARRTDALQQVLAREQLFTADVSHELRTPLTIILGAAELLAALPAAQPMQHAAAERIRRVAAETAERVSALLLLSRAPDTVSAPQTLLNAIIEAEISRCQPLLAGKEVSWQRQDTSNVSVAVHPELAAIMIGNLLRNACRHTESGYISVQLSQQQLIIEDSGSGIPVQIRARLFERFVHGDTQPPHEGTGLGLAIVKRVADHAGWHIVLQDADSGGSRFVITFPAASGPVSS